MKTIFIISIGFDVDFIYFNSALTDEYPDNKKKI
jgi:hypothetical protein